MRPQMRVVQIKDLPMTVAEPYHRLTSQNISLSERVSAASELLSYEQPEAETALCSAMSEQFSAVTWQAIFQAIITRSENPPERYSVYLIGMMDRVDDSLMPDLAAALGRFDDRRMVNRLLELSTDASQSIRARQCATLSLGYYRQKRVGKSLMTLNQPSEPVAVQEAAFKALAILSGLESYGSDRRLWTRWWSEVENLSGKDWYRHLLVNFSRYQTNQRVHTHQVEDRLLESQRALYRTTAVEDRPAVLSYMLAEPLMPIRELAMDLALQRLLANEPFDEPLRAALRARLTDKSANIRQRATLLLRDLADQPAADLVALRLEFQEEQVPSVLRASLLMMSRLPRTEAVEPAYEMLADESLRGEAAGALAAAADAGFLSEKLAGKSARRVRRYLPVQGPPAPQVITLLGKIGNHEDWSRIADWVDNPDPAVKQSAAQAWADSNRSLKLLAERAGDPIVQPIVIVAATQRGSDPWTLRALARNRPEQQQTVEAWQRALIAMAGRVPADTILPTVKLLVANNEPASFRDQILTAAIDHAMSTEKPDDALLGLLLERAETRMAMGNPGPALGDYQRLEGPIDQLSDKDRDRLDRGMIKAYLLLGQVDEAFDVARRLLGIVERDGILPPTDDPVIDLFVETARRHATNNRLDHASAILTKLRLLLGPRIKPEVAQRVALLEAQISGGRAAEREAAESGEAGVRAQVNQLESGTEQVGTDESTPTESMESVGKVSE